MKIATKIDRTKYPKHGPIDSELDLSSDKIELKVDDGIIKDYLEPAVPWSDLGGMGVSMESADRI